MNPSSSFKANKNGTVNRKTLMTLVKEGKLVAQCKYRMTDDYAYDAATGFGRTEELPCRLKVDNKDYLEGYINFDVFDFKSSSGMAYVNPDGSCTLKVHGNESWTLKFKRAGE